MLDRISNEHSDAISQSSINRVSNIGVSSNYNTDERDLFVDESSISDAAIKLYEREQDVQKFAKLALSDQDDNSADALVVSKVFDGQISIDDDEAVFSLLSNEDFLNEIAS